MAKNSSNFTMSDFKILLAVASVKRNGERVGGSSLKAVTVKEVGSLIKLSNVKIHQTLSAFIDYGYIQEGLKIGKAKTFYVTETGFSFLLELKKDGVKLEEVI